MSSLPGECNPWNLLTDALAAASIAGVIIAVLIPVLAGLTQFISVKLSQAGAGGAAMSDDNPMAASMKTMTYTMPLISVVFGFTLPAGLGLYSGRSRYRISWICICQRIRIFDGRCKRCCKRCGRGMLRT